MESRLSTIIGAVGRLLIGLGLTVLAFAGYQLWGTGLQEERAQSSLEDDFEERQAALQLLTDEASTPTTAPTTTQPAVAEPDSPTTAPATTAPSTSAAPPSIAPALAAELLPARGEAMGHIRIPSIDVDKVFINGVGRDDLRTGPGHYPTTPLPGQEGNAAIAGHRTTYGQPFHNLDLVQPGDIIEVETLQGVFFYEVEGHANADGDAVGHFIVDPGRTDVVEDHGDNRLTLTACHPKYSARQRIIVTAVMVGEPAPPLPITTTTQNADDEQLGADEDLAAEDEGNTVGIEEETLEESLGWHWEELNITLVWAALCCFVLFAGWLLSRQWRKWPAYAATAPVFLFAMFIMFGHLDRMLPAL